MKFFRTGDSMVKCCVVFNATRGLLGIKKSPGEEIIYALSLQHRVSEALKKRENLCTSLSKCFIQRSLAGIKSPLIDKVV